ncbi:FAD-dependent oxidoreductase [Formosa haliotis]|uniref:FAD-dependent oxidoreductase n=1 Tax=Formosa haliotis TaxID=1555194 RepID=UPI000AF27625|nr:FAD-dependent oxidoreductase [Formosa haliotis]
MLEHTKHKTCVVIGASHAGVNFAFNLRREGWQGDILVFDSDPEMPYHRPPLSKTYITSEDDSIIDTLFPEQNYKTDAITLNLGKTILAINKHEKSSRC